MFWRSPFRPYSVVATGPIGLVRGLATNQTEPKLIHVLAAVAIAMAHPQSPVDDTSTMAVCSYEDGNTDGLPCVWTDPDTGARYYVDSSNYR
jgi:hypothetical protein